MNAIFTNVLFIEKHLLNFKFRKTKEKNNSSIYYVNSNLRKWTIRSFHDREYWHLTNSFINISNKQFQHSWHLKTLILTNRLNILDLLQILPSSEIVMGMIIGPSCLLRTQLCGVTGCKSQSPQEGRVYSNSKFAVVKRFCFLSFTKSEQMGYMQSQYPRHRF